ncbi:hypothetical protein NIES4073_25280 [Kalymmatonema gypsitolerans NIES-4073]|nr:hypothetical protein NIES4073_25280 [Scytonema sp. NIES-4073]
MGYSTLTLSELVRTILVPFRARLLKIPLELLFSIAPVNRFSQVTQRQHNASRQICTNIVLLSSQNNLAVILRKNSLVYSQTQDLMLVYFRLYPYYQAYRFHLKDELSLSLQYKRY